MYIVCVSMYMIFWACFEHLVLGGSEYKRYKNNEPLKSNYK